MKKFYFLTLFSVLVGLSTIVNAQAPNWVWAKKIGGTSFSNEIGNCIATDVSGNVYTAGNFGGTVDFDPGAGVYNLTATGSEGIFISKLNSSGNFIWAKLLNVLNVLYNCNSIVVDASGSVFLTGAFSGTVDFDSGPGVFNLTAVAVDDIFIWKLDTAGNFVWAKSMGGTSVDYGYSLALDTFGNVYTTGSFRGTVDFDPGVGTYNLTSPGTDNIFISKLDSAGNFIWAKAMGNPDNALASAIAINPSASADVYITGYFNGTGDFDPGTGVFNLSTAGFEDDFFICKLDSAGNFIWAKSMGTGTGNDFAYSIVFDPTGSGYVYVKGSIDGTVDFDPGPGVFNLTGNNTNGNGGYILKLNSAGNFVWAIALGGGAGVSSSSLALDSSGNIYTSGAFHGTVDFDPGPAIFNLTAVVNDMYVSKYNKAGNFSWVKKAGGSNVDVGRALALDASGNVYITGPYYSTSITFGTDRKSVV